MRAYDFRFAPESGHCATESAYPFRAPKAEVTSPTQPNPAHRRRGWLQGGGRSFGKTRFAKRIAALAKTRWHSRQPDQSHIANTRDRLRAVFLFGTCGSIHIPVANTRLGIPDATLPCAQRS